VPFVGTIHLAANPAGNSSRLMALTREQLEGASDASAASVLAAGSSSAVSV
jgi:hypothetical protein